MMENAVHGGSAKWIQFLVLLGIGILLTWLALRGQPLGELGTRLIAARWEWVALGLVLTLLGHVSRAMRWRLLIAGAGHHVGWLPCFVAMMTGYLSNLGIPRVGELGRCASLARITGAPLLTLGGTVVVERAVDVATLVALVSATFVLAQAQIGVFWEAEVAGPLAALLSWKLLLAATFGLGLLAALAWFVAQRQLRAGAERLRGWAAQIWNGMASAWRLRRKGLFLLHTLVIWLSYYSAPVCSLMALDIAGERIFLVGFLTFVFGSMARTLPLPAGSMGAYHYLIRGLMIALGYAAADGMAMATLNHAVQTAFYLALGIVGLAGFFVLLRRQQVAEFETDLKD